jgi:lipoyl(octanoyl) transferase
MAHVTAPPFVDWGRTDYRAALARQAALVEARRAARAPDTLVFTEHDPVFTLGARPGAAKNVLWNAAALKKHGLAVVETTRGGDVTYHGPGQIVGYPVVSLEPRRDLHAYLRALEQTLINTLGCFGLATARRAGQTGVWVGRRKIAAIGVAARAWIAWHGFALNVDGDLAPYAGIVPCGLGPEIGEVTSLALELGDKNVPSKEEIKNVLAAEFWRQFQEYSQSRKQQRDKGTEGQRRKAK